MEAPTAGTVWRQASLRGRRVVELALLPERALLDEAALGEALGVSKRTVRRMAGRGELPPAVRMGGRAMWQAGRVLAWFETKADRAAREAKRAENFLGVDR